MIIKLQNGNILKLSKEEQKYLEWSKMTPKQKREYRINRAKSHLQSGPNITNFWEAFQTYMGNRDPKNPHLNIGIVNVPGRATPQQVQQSAKLMETINNYWKNLGKLKIRLGGNGKYASGILTKPGTAPTTFNGQNINYITSPKGGNVTHKFYTDQGSEYILTKDGFARRVKSSHANTGGADAGLHEWNKGATRFLDSDELGWSYQAWTDRTKPLGFSEKDGIISLVTKDNGKWRYIMRSELRPNAVKNGTIKDGIIQSAYTTEPKVGKWMLEYGTNPTGEINWFHPGSQVAFIEGLKQGGFIKSANARKWKHKEGGKAFVNGVSILDSNPDAYKYVKKKYKMAQEGTKLTFGQKVGNFLNSDLGQFAANAAGQFVNGIWQNKQQNKIKNELNQWKKSYINSITPEDYSQQVAAEEQQLMQENPDYNSSPIVQAYKNNILANNSLTAAKQKAEQEANQVIANYQLNNNQNWGNLLSQGLGLAGQYLSNKKQAT